MATVIDKTTEASLLNSPTRQLRTRSVAKRNGTVRDDYRLYELGVLAVTQLSYIPVTASMLSTSFYEPSPEFCKRMKADVNNTINWQEKGFEEREFLSLLLDTNEACRDSAVVATLSTSLMVGALLGAFVCGWLADAYGRKPVIRGTLIMIFACNIFFTILAASSWFFTALVLFFLGSASGGYMVTNLVLLVECLESPRSRLLAVSLNGWSVSMAVVAGMAALTRHWVHFHLLTALTALIAAAACQLLCYESCRWLAGVHRTTEAHISATKVAERNSFKTSPDATWWELVGFSAPVPTVNNNNGKGSGELEEVKTYGYADLFSVSSVYLPLIVLCYCFVASAIVSYGLYFNADSLPGDRYSTMAFMGLSKFTTGLIPFAVSQWVGRKPILILSVGVGCAAVWAVCISQSLGDYRAHWSLTVLSLIVQSSLDPTWKIIHLYSAELFPTVVRNMARGICNVAARIGSAAAPFIVQLRTIHYLIPYYVFAALLSVQFLVAIVYMPETKDRPLPDAFPPRERKGEGKEGMECREI